MKIFSNAFRALLNRKPRFTLPEESSKASVKQTPRNLYYKNSFSAQDRYDPNHYKNYTGGGPTPMPISVPKSDYAYLPVPDYAPKPRLAKKS